MDLPKALAEEWGVPLAVDFADIETSRRHAQRGAHAPAPRCDLPVDDSATLLAAQADAALGLPHNPPEAAEAARDKGIMRRLMDEAGVPCPVFRRFPLASDPR